MGFRKYAYSNLVKPLITLEGWNSIKKAPTIESGSKIASKVVLQSYDPSQYLLSHCTIMASVDTEGGPGPLGKQVVNGLEINRKYSDYYITPETSKFINSNFDAWDREVLLSSYKTFIGAENFQEHIQIPELSKGKVIDAVARDIGESVYIDILVATDRKHKALIKAIESGELSTLSMGCFLPGTLVTLSDGTRIPIESIVPGDMVLTHKGRSREVLNRQTIIGTKKIVHIDAVGVPTTISSTDNHPFFIIRDREVCGCGCGEALSEIKCKAQHQTLRKLTRAFKRGHDKRLLNPNNTYSLSEYQSRKKQIESAKKLNLIEVEAKDLRVGDFLCFPKMVVESESTISKARARLLGYFVAEGSFLKHKGTPVEVQFNFSLSEKDTFVQEVVELIRNGFPGSNPWVQERPEETGCVIHLYGKDIAQWFLNHGGQYSDQKRLSSEVMSWSIESQRELLGAWVNGDGCRNNANSSTSITTTSFDLACQAHALLTRCGLFPRISSQLGDRSIVDLKEAIGQTYTIFSESFGRVINCKTFYTITFGKSFSQVLASESSKIPSEEVKDFSGLRVLDDMIIFPIREISYDSYQGPVYDLEVDEDHSYIADGVSVHNCQVAFTVCSKCGNVGEDEIQLCPCIRYMKGNTFIDERGKTRKVAEICGSIHEEPGSVTFIEASWVGNPAFKGAVVRNILDPKTAESQSTKKMIQVAFSQPSRVMDPEALQKVANQISTVVSTVNRPTHQKTQLGSYEDLKRAVQDTGRIHRPISDKSRVKSAQDSPPESSQGQDPKKDTDSKNPFEGLSKDLYEALIEHVADKVRNEISQEDSSRTRDVVDENSSNQSLIKSALYHSDSVVASIWRKRASYVLKMAGNPSMARKILAGLILYYNGGWEAIRDTQRFSGREILAVSRIVDRLTKKSSMAGESRIYSVVLAVQGTRPYKNVQDYLAACRKVVGRELTDLEKSELVMKGKLYSFGS